MLALMGILSVALLPQNMAKAEQALSLSSVKQTDVLSEQAPVLLPLPKRLEKPNKPNPIVYEKSYQNIDIKKNPIPSSTLIWDKTRSVDAYQITFHIEYETASGKHINYHDEWFEEIEAGADIVEQSARYRAAKAQWDFMEDYRQEQNEKQLADFYEKLEQYQRSQKALAIAKKLNQQIQAEYESRLRN